MTAITNEYMRQMCQWFHFVARALSLDYLDPLVNPDAATWGSMEHDSRLLVRCNTQSLRRGRPGPARNEPHLAAWPARSWELHFLLFQRVSASSKGKDIDDA